MAGSDGNRGYLVQTLIALLDSLRSNDWDRVTIEPSQESEKVDVLWESGTFRKATQVKSSLSQINKPDAQRWARELDANTVADELELVLVGSASSAVTRIGRIGRVSVPRPKNLDWDGLISEATHLLDCFLYKNGLESVSPDRSRLLAKGLVTELSNLASHSQSLSRSELISMLAEWIQAIAPDATRSLHDSVLSKSPRSLRPNLGSKLIGRDEKVHWLRETEGDKLIVGQPGIGKTFLLQKYVGERSSSFFLRTDDEGKIEQAIRLMSPSAIVVEDAHIHTEAIEFLRRLRADLGSSFAIVADCWPGSRDLMIDKMGVRAATCLELQPVSDQDIVDIVRDCVVKPSNSFLHMVVSQASGFPGRAMMLVETCLGGTHEEYRNFWNGETLARWVRTRFTDLIGREAIQVLACFAIGGAAGVTAEAVEKALQLSRAKVLEIVANLALGGVLVDLGTSRIAVVPRSIRAILVRDHFFGSAAIPRADFLQDHVALSDTVTTLVEAYTLGADFPTAELRTLVRESNTLASWRALVHSSDDNAKFVLAEVPSLIRDLARDFLQMVPSLVIPELLRLADGDLRPLHSNPNHPIRLLSDWVKSGYPGRQAFKRRRQVLDAFRELVDENTDLAFRLLPIAVSPEYEDMEQNPGNRSEYAIRSGCVSIEDLQCIAESWSEILDALRRVNIEDWKPVLEAAREWLWPHFGGGATVSDEQRAVIDSSASAILSPLVNLAVDRPGVLRDLAQIAEIHKAEISYIIHPSYDALFPREPSYEGGHEERQSEFAALHTKSHALGESWAGNEPAEVVAEISHWIAESAFCGHPGQICVRLALMQYQLQSTSSFRGFERSWT